MQSERPAEMGEATRVEAPRAIEPNAQTALAATSGGPAQQPTASLSPIAEPARETPHDFATLIDRLTQAREAASPEGVRATLAHEQFGRVSMQLKVEDGGLTVQMASADPEFTPAVQAAVLAAGQAQQGSDQAQQHARQDNAAQNSPQQASTSTNGQSDPQQPRGGASVGSGREERSDGQRGQSRQDADRQAERQPRPSSEQRPGRRGLYA